MRRFKIILMVATILTLAVVASATPPPIFSYQGRLTDASGNPVPDSSYVVSFRFYSSSTGDGILYWEGHRIFPKNGLFTVGFGEHGYMDPAFLKDTAVWLGMQIEGQPEMTPRVRLAAAPYSLETQAVYGTYEGALRTSFSAATKDSAGLVIYDTVGNRAVAIAQTGQANFLNVRRTDAPHTGCRLYSGEDGTRLTLYNAGGYTKVLLTPDEKGDDAVMIPDSSISAREMQNEPGLSANDNAGPVVLMATTTDVVTTSLTAPTDGYVLVIGKATAFLSGNMGINYGYLQIDTAAGGNAEAPYRTVFGSEMMWSGAVSCFPVTVTRVFLISAGSHTFRLEGRNSGLQGTGNVVDIRNAMIQAVFIPSSYGTVNTLVSASESGQFEQKEAVQLDGQTMYRVDLRELEVKAAKAEAEAQRLKAELLEARLRESEK